MTVASRRWCAKDARSWPSISIGACWRGAIWRCSVRCEVSPPRAIGGNHGGGIDNVRAAVLADVQQRLSRGHEARLFHHQRIGIPRVEAHQTDLHLPQRKSDGVAILNGLLSPRGPEAGRGDDDFL